ncbi:MAG: hypothetical protein ABFS46_12225, partial [Myxococcota bacterium]
MWRADDGNRCCVLGVALAVGAILLPTDPGRAAPIEYRVEGTVTSVDAALSSRFQAGDPMVVTAVIDTATGPVIRPEGTRYNGADVSALWMDYAVPESEPNSSVSVLDDPAGDQFAINGRLSGLDPPIGAFVPTNLDVLLGDSSGTVFSSTAPGRCEPGPSDRPPSRC